LEKLFNIVNYLAEAERKIRYTRHPWILLEMLVIKFTAVENYSLKEVEEKKDEHFIDFSTKKDVSISSKRNTEKREELPPKKKIQDKIKSKECPSVKAKETPINLELTQAWPTILERIKKTKMAVYSFILANNFITIENNKLIIGFNKEYTFHKESLEKKNNKILLQDLIKEETGRLLTIECIINDNGKKDSVLEVEQENKKKAARTRSEEDKEREGRAGEEKDNIKKRNNEVPENNILIKESLNLFELAQKEVRVSSGGGMIEIVVNGQQEIKEIKIEPDVIDANEKEMLEDLILAAINESIRQSKELAAQEMSKLTGGMNVPGLF
jgi:DNA-binding YbaB/EbfC family protein